MGPGSREDARSGLQTRLALGIEAANELMHPLPRDSVVRATSAFVRSSILTADEIGLVVHTLLIQREKWHDILS